jgi:hypothetical protein
MFVLRTAEVEYEQGIELFVKRSEGTTVLCGHEHVRPATRPRPVCCFKFTSCQNIAKWHTQKGNASLKMFPIKRTGYM